MEECIMRACCDTCIKEPHESHCAIGIDKDIETARWIDGYFNHSASALHRRTRFYGNGSHHVFPIDPRPGILSLPLHGYDPR